MFFGTDNFAVQHYLGLHHDLCSGHNDDDCKHDCTHHQHHSHYDFKAHSYRNDFRNDDYKACHPSFNHRIGYKWRPYTEGRSSDSRHRRGNGCCDCSLRVWTSVTVCLQYRHCFRYAFDRAKLSRYKPNVKNSGRLLGSSACCRYHS
ncbi:hypothetical protein HYPSUDRAFT_45869 [Hypholoma sublateritium FD-334 SS-4]|uniref:Uncharacterized protein n=1 Tax=Hypholoma sublateritium (strain FD-334 SS-4) TaxID=945553 RepID=A0A0D2NFW4_HYPSF|nr:hypothetical protein HYPSUDRAFT_45869 [Hypholoma sublateritium FD-334 SS-4]